jgi:hypothetical protein
LALQLAVLDCALKGPAEGKQLPEETFRLYLNGCHLFWPTPIASIPSR